MNRLLFLINGANQQRHDLYPDHPNDTWKLSLALRKWTKVADKVAGDPHPPTDAGSFAGSAYDPLAKRILYFAVDNAGTSHTWQLDPLVGKWSLRSDAPNAADIHVASAGFAVDTKRNRVLAYGGQYNTSCCLTTSLRAYDFATNRWSLLADAPIPAHGAEFAYDSLHDIFLALVGTTTLIYMPTTNTWKTMPGTINRGANQTRQNIAYNVAQDVFVFQGGTMVQAIWAVFRYGGTVITPPPMPPGTPTNLAIIR